jgi:hypothetical protein
MATKIILAGDLCVIDSHDEFLLTIDGEALGKVVGKENAEKSVIVIAFLAKRSTTVLSFLPRLLDTL